MTLKDKIGTLTGKLECYPCGNKKHSSPLGVIDTIHTLNLNTMIAKCNVCGNETEMHK